MGFGGKKNRVRSAVASTLSTVARIPRQGFGGSKLTTGRRHAPPAWFRISVWPGPSVAVCVTTGSLLEASRKPAWTWQTPACEDKAVLMTASRKMSGLVVLAKPKTVLAWKWSGGARGKACAMRFVRPLVASTISKVDRIPRQGWGGVKFICGRRLIWVGSVEVLAAVFLTAVVV